MTHTTPLDDYYFMRQASEEAHTAFSMNEVPIGAVIVYDGRIIARAHNRTEALNDVTAHAEMQVITAAANVLGGKYLTGCTLYVTLEPCPMCAAALRWAQISRVVYGTADPQRGYSQISPHLLHPKTVVTCVNDLYGSELLKSFFAHLRK
jgi:tRNA(adenine34) deaminase